MSVGTHENTITKIAAADLARGICVKLKQADASKVEACAATDINAIGVLLDDVAIGDNVAVALFGVANSTLVCIASGAIAVGAKVCLGANGKVAACPSAGEAAQSVVCVGLALTDAIIDGNEIELAHRAPSIEVIAAA